MLASDLNNPEFIGATDPDSLIHVEFYMHKPKLKFQSDQKSYAEGRKVEIFGKEAPYVRIMTPGDNTSVLQVPVRESHKRRFPKQWLVFQMEQGLIEEQEIPGWKLEDWPYLQDNPELLRDLKHMRFQTVEQLSGMSDAQCQKLGMVGQGLKQRALKDVREKLMGDARAEAEEKDRKINALESENTALKDQMNTVLERLEKLEKKKKSG